MHQLILAFAFTVVGALASLSLQAVRAAAGTATFTGTAQTLTGDITAARIVGSANSSYFIDPASSGTSLSLAGAASISGNLTLPQGAAMRPAFGPTTLSYKSGVDAWTTGLIIQDGTGNIGIGTTTPGQKLSVAGTIESTTGGVKFPDGTTQTTAFTGGAETAGQIAFFAAACPTGWTEYTALRGRYVVGNPLSGTLATAVGTALTNLENRAVGQHNHTVTDPGHSHTYGWSAACCGGSNPGGSNNDSGSRGTSSSGAGISINNSGSVAGTNAPYIQLTACQKN